MIRNLSQKQLDVMKILWDAGTPLVASDKSRKFHEH